MILAFHDHDQELPIFSELLLSSCFFIGAIGSRNAHAVRKAALERQASPRRKSTGSRARRVLSQGLRPRPLSRCRFSTQIVATAREKRIVS